MSLSKRFVFSPLERNVLLELVLQHKDVLNNGKGNAVLKKLTWETIRDLFNSTPGVRCCDAKQLKKCWENLRARAKQEVLLGENGRMNMLAELNEMNRSFLTEISTQLLSQHSPTNDSERNDSETITVTDGFSPVTRLSDDIDHKEPNCVQIRKLQRPMKLMRFTTNHEEESIPMKKQKLSDKDLEYEIKRKEHEAKMAKFKLQQECIRAEHEAKMLLYQTQTEYYKAKAMQLSSNSEQYDD